MNRRRREIVRLIQEKLQEYGFHDTLLALQRESGILMESEAVSVFKRLVMERSYERTVLMVDELMLGEANRRRAKFWLYREQFIELVWKKSRLEALVTLQRQLAPLCQDDEEAAFYSYILVANNAEVRRSIGWFGNQEAASRRLIGELCLLMPSSIVVPVDRMGLLFEQALDFQASQCRYHVEEGDADASLLADHRCPDGVIEQLLNLCPRHELPERRGEVWGLTFSACGRFLASASSNQKVFIHKLSGSDLCYELLAIIDDLHTAPSALSFSPDSTYLLICTPSPAGGGGLWEVHTGSWRWRESAGVDAAVWLDNRLFVMAHSAGAEVGIYVKEVEANHIEHRLPVDAAVSGLAVDLAGRVVYFSSDASIAAVSLATRKAVMRMDIPTGPASISCIQFSSATKRLLVGVNNNVIFLVNPATRVIEHTFSGHFNLTRRLRCSFAGINDQLVVSGSEDGQIYVWNARHGALVKIIDEFRGSVAVNEIVQHPCGPHVLASASDDGRVVLWKSALNDGQ